MHACISQSLRDGLKHGAAVLGVPMKATVKVWSSLHVSSSCRAVPRVSSPSSFAQSNRPSFLCSSTHHARSSLLFSHVCVCVTRPDPTTRQESEDGEFVLRTINRARLWEIQTPQVVKPKILADAFKHVQDNGCGAAVHMWTRWGSRSTPSSGPSIQATTNPLEIDTTGWR